MPCPPRRQDLTWKAIDRYSKDYVELQTKDKVKFYKTPDAILQQQLDIYDKIAEKKSADNPIFKEIVESQKAFAERAVKWDMDNNVNRRMAYNHYFGRQEARPRRRRPDREPRSDDTIRRPRMVFFLVAPGPATEAAR